MCASPASVICVFLRYNFCKLVQPSKVLEPRVRDLGAPEAQISELVQPLKMLKPGVRDQGGIEVQRLESGQTVEVFQPSVRERGLATGKGVVASNPNNVREELVPEQLPQPGWFWLSCP